MRGCVGAWVRGCVSAQCGVASHKCPHPPPRTFKNTNELLEGTHEYSINFFLTERQRPRFGYPASFTQKRDTSFSGTPREAVDMSCALINVSLPSVRSGGREGRVGAGSGEGVDEGDGGGGRGGVGVGGTWARVYGPTRVCVCGGPFQHHLLCDPAAVVGTRAQGCA